MKKLLTLIALGSVALASAGQYHHQGNVYRGDCSSCCDDGIYQDDDYSQNCRQRRRSYSRIENRQLNDRYSNSGDQFYGQDQYNVQPVQSYGDQNMNYDNSNRGNNPTNVSVSDQEIIKKIQDTLSSGWFSKGFTNVTYDVNRGFVTLKGTVDTLENINKVEESVRKIDGVKEINNQIRVSNENANANAYSDSQLQDSEKKFPRDAAASPQDRQINAKIRDKLNSGWFSKGYETLVVRTANGIVIISGNVDNPEDIQTINDQLKEVDGVKSVNNQLNVKNQNR